MKGSQEKSLGESLSIGVDDTVNHSREKDAFQLT